MKNPFKRKKAAVTEAPETARAEVQDNTVTETPQEPAPAEESPSKSAPEAQDDGFDEWSRSQVRGGIERRERNDIYEAYNVYGADAEGRLCCRCYHRYPEHERDFGLSYTRVLSFDEFNRRLLAELDRGDMKLADCNACLIRARSLAGGDGAVADSPAYEGFTDGEEAALRGFCDSIDTLKDMSYLHSEGVLSCECESVAGGERLIIRFRKMMTHDALETDVAGVKKESIAGYDIDDMWILGIHNRLRERCSSVKVTRLSSEWSLEKESLYIMRAEGFGGVEGALLAAVGEADSFRRFGFYSLDFSKK